MRKHFDLGSLIVIVITFILFAVALFTKGFTHDLLLESGVFLVSVKLILMAYKSSVDAIELKRGDKVILPSFTFGATAEVVCYFGADPIFMDVDPKSFNISVDKIEEYLNYDRDEIPRTKAIMPVHFAGQACDMAEILRLADRMDGGLRLVVPGPGGCLGSRAV